MNFNHTLQSQETLPAILSRMAKSDPDTLFAYEVSGQAISWGELQQQVEVWMARFIKLGVRRKEVVVTLLDSDLQSLALWLGLASIGAIDASTNAQFRGRMLAYAINNCQPSLVIVTASYLPILETIADELETVTTVLVLDQDQEEGAFLQQTQLPGLTSVKSLPSSASHDIRNYLVTPQLHDIACVTYTSGTTGPSKAVRLPWGQLNAINLATLPFEDLDATDVFYCFTAHAHFGSKSIPYLAAMTGGRVVIRSRFSLSSFWEDIGRFGITTASLVGSMAPMLIDSPDSPPKNTSLRNMFMAPLGASYQQFSERFGVRICTVYNSTEGGVPVCSGWNPENPKTVGRLRQGYPGFEVRIVDEHDYEVPDGKPGELVVRSSVPWTMNAGYLNNPDATAAAWRNGWFHTGDALMRTSEGDYIFVDRLKDVIRRRGENISSFEVEADVLLNDAVAECAAIAVPADTTEDEILLFVVKRAGASINEQELAVDLEARMTRFMVPRYIEFIQCLPKTQATERIVKAQLREQGISTRTWDRERTAYVSRSDPSITSTIIQAIPEQTPKEIDHDPR